MPAVERWRATWQGLGAGTAEDELYRDLVSRYTEPHRHYHTLHHLDECFASLDEARSLKERIFEVELATWFHDAVYDVRRNDNEERSASQAAQAIAQAGLPGSWPSGRFTNRPCRFTARSPADRARPAARPPRS